MRRIFVFLSFSLILGVLFHLPIIGFCFRFLLKQSHDIDAHYRDLHWEGKSLVFEDLYLNAPSFQSSIEGLHLRFRPSFSPLGILREIEVKAPFVAIKDPLSFPFGKKSGEALKVLLTISDGILEWDGPVAFEGKSFLDKAELSLKWKDSGIFLEKNADLFTARLENFALEKIHRWVSSGKRIGGVVDGRVDFSKDKEILSSHLEWKKGFISMDKSTISHIEGMLSYRKGLGAKWEFLAEAKEEKSVYPLALSGKSFFQSNWIESSFLIDRAKCSFSGDEAWNFECEDLEIEKLSPFKQILAEFWPKLLEFREEKGVLNAKVLISPKLWSARFTLDEVFFLREDKSFSFQKAMGELSHLGGDFSLKGEDFSFAFQGPWKDFHVDLQAFGESNAFSGYLEGNKAYFVVEEGVFQEASFSGKGWIDSSLNGSASFKGSWEFLGNKIPFYCPIASKEGSDWYIDFRFIQKNFDLLRLSLTFDGETLRCTEKSFFLQSPLCFPTLKIGDFDVEFALSSSSLLALKPLFSHIPVPSAILPKIDEHLCVECSYKEGFWEGKVQGDKGDFFASFRKGKSGWEIALDSEWKAQAVFSSDGSISGWGKWKNVAEGEFSGRVDSDFRWEFAIPKFYFDLSVFQDPKYGGVLRGGGHVIYDKKLEADLDCSLEGLKFGDYELENEGMIHLAYDSEEGARFRGVNLRGPFDCKIDLFAFQKKDSSWSLKGAHFYADVEMFPFLPTQVFDRSKKLNFTADLFFPSDFSFLSCALREGDLPLRGKYYHIENLRLDWRDARCFFALDYQGDFFQGYWNAKDNICGKLSLGKEAMPLTIDWSYEKDLLIHSIEGSFGGIEASFHEESPNVLLGSAHLDFTSLSERVPQEIKEVFSELKMGKGYELKGRLKIEDEIPSFQGILGGKNIELFGYQMRTILAMIEIEKTRVELRDVKISDSAGSMKIDGIFLEGKEKDPWTVWIPKIAISEFRPSLLLKVGGTLGPLDPIVVRRLELNDFRGLLEEKKSYRATGKLSFINSYKREDTVFDLPANVLSRIVGLDLELLIPVKGSLTFDLREGYFRLLELSDAFSENRRSQFFLEMDPPPRMDLDGNLEILIKMKQFVLLKFTESFLISIEGNLKDPDFHLKKKSLFGLL